VPESLQKSFLPRKNKINKKICFFLSLTFLGLKIEIAKEKYDLGEYFQIKIIKNADL
jgi:hypothetical protein